MARMPYAWSFACWEGRVCSPGAWQQSFAQSSRDLAWSRATKKGEPKVCTVPDVQLCTSGHARTRKAGRSVGWF